MEYLQLFVLAFIVEALTEYFLGKAVDRISVLTPYKWAMIYPTALIGVAFALVYKIDILQAVGLPPNIWGQVLSGFVIGRGSNFVNDVYSKIRQGRPPPR